MEYRRTAWFNPVEGSFPHLQVKISRLQAIWRLRCPRCLSGEVFESLWKMRRTCPSCQLEYEREQGYFLGAMYISYGMGLALGVPMLLWMRVFWNFSRTEFLLALVLTLALLSPLMFRYSRIFWIHIDQCVDPR